MKKTILIVDDALLYRELLKSIIEQLGFATESCDDGSTAIAYLAEHNEKISAVILDVNMPEIDGISALGHFSSKYPNLPVIMITGSEDASDARSAVGLGALGFIQKPLQTNSIGKTIRALLESRGITASA